MAIYAYIHKHLEPEPIFFCILKSNIKELKNSATGKEFQSI